MHAGVLYVRSARWTPRPWKLGERLLHPRIVSEKLLAEAEQKYIHMNQTKHATDQERSVEQRVGYIPTKMRPRFPRSKEASAKPS